MSTRQLRLIPHSQPLLDRFGAEFFRRIPKRPGVYIMRDAHDRVLYIGQSRNLRVRLASYKNARPGAVPRKVIRLVHQVRSLAWEECESGAAAEARERELIQRHRPRFNRAMTWPATWFFLGLRREAEVVRLRWADEPEGEAGERMFGAFKGRMLGRKVVRALGRSLWACRVEPDSLHAFPLRFSHRNRELMVGCEASLLSDLTPYLEGRDPALVTRMTSVLLGGEDLQPGLQEVYARDMELLTDFFERSLSVVHELERRTGRAQPLWDPDILAEQAGGRFFFQPGAQTERGPDFQGELMFRG